MPDQTIVIRFSSLEGVRDVDVKTKASTWPQLKADVAREVCCPSRQTVHLWDRKRGSDGPLPLNLVWDDIFGGKLRLSASLVEQTEEDDGFVIESSSTPFAAASASPPLTTGSLALSPSSGLDEEKVKLEALATGSSLDAQDEGRQPSPSTSDKDVKVNQLKRSCSPNLDLDHHFVPRRSGRPRISSGGRLPSAQVKRQDDMSADEDDMMVSSGDGVDGIEGEDVDIECKPETAIKPKIEVKPKVERKPEIIPDPENPNSDPRPAGFNPASSKTWHLLPDASGPPQVEVVALLDGKNPMDELVAAEEGPIHFKRRDLGGHQQHTTSSYKQPARERHNMTRFTLDARRNLIPQHDKSDTRRLMAFFGGNDSGTDLKEKNPIVFIQRTSGGRCWEFLGEMKERWQGMLLDGEYQRAVQEDPQSAEALLDACVEYTIKRERDTLPYWGFSEPFTRASINEDLEVNVIKIRFVIFTSKEAPLSDSGRNEIKECLERRQ